MKHQMRFVTSIFVFFTILTPKIFAKDSSVSQNILNEDLIEQCSKETSLKNYQCLKEKMKIILFPPSTTYQVLIGSTNTPKVIPNSSTSSFNSSTTTDTNQMPNSNNNQGANTDKSNIKNYLS